MPRGAGLKNARRDSSIGVGIYDDMSQQFIDLLKVSLMERFSETHLPEIFDAFGREGFLKFLSIFSGVTIKVPESTVLEEAIRDVNIFFTLKKARRGTRSKIFQELSRRHHLGLGALRRIYHEMSGRMGRYRIRRIPGG
jgi:hypothetical protein